MRLEPLEKQNRGVQRLMAFIETGTREEGIQQQSTSDPTEGADQALLHQGHWGEALSMEQQKREKQEEGRDGGGRKKGLP